MLCHVVFYPPACHMLVVCADIYHSGLARFFPFFLYIHTLCMMLVTLISFFFPNNHLYRGISYVRTTYVCFWEI